MQDKLKSVHFIQIFELRGTLTKFTDKLQHIIFYSSYCD